MDGLIEQMVIREALKITASRVGLFYRIMRKNRAIRMIKMQSFFGKYCEAQKFDVIKIRRVSSYIKTMDDQPWMG